MRSFNTLYKNAKKWTLGRGYDLESEDMYRIFRNEIELETGKSLDSEQSMAVYEKITGTMSVKQMCKNYYHIVEAELDYAS